MIITPILKRAVRIMIVDHEEMLTNSLVKGLRGNGYESIMTANTARSCVEQLETKPCDIAIIGIVIPDTDGFQLGEILREHYPDMPLIALIPELASEDVFKAKAVGFNALINKPFSIEDFLKVLGSQILHLDSPANVFATASKSNETILIWG